MKKLLLLSLFLFSCFAPQQQAIVLRVSGDFAVAQTDSLTIMTCNSPNDSLHVGDSLLVRRNHDGSWQIISKVKK